jgi:hypothetical protein
VALPGAYAPASIALRVIGAHKLPLHDTAVVLEEDKHGLEKTKILLLHEFLEYI